MDVLKKHYETLTILMSTAALMIGACMWLNGKFSEITERIDRINNRLTKIETVLVMRGIMPSQLACSEDE